MPAPTIKTVADAAGVSTTTVSFVLNGTGSAGAAVRDLSARRVDALIAVFSKTDRHPAADEALTRSGAPHVLAYYHAPDDAGIDNVSVDQEQGGHLATAYLLGKGRRRVAYAGGPEARNATRQRLAGYRRALAEHGAEHNPAHVTFGLFSVATGEEAAARLFDGVPRDSAPDAVFAGDDDIAAGLIRALRRRGLRVPDDVAVVGFNDSPLADALDPPLTSVHMPLEEVGRLCVERAIAHVADRAVWQPSSLVLPCTLTVRESA
jgi:LacI family transcriptional regulator